VGRPWIRSWFFFSGLFSQSSRKLRNMPLVLANNLNKLQPHLAPPFPPVLSCASGPPYKHCWPWRASHGVCRELWVAQLRHLWLRGFCERGPERAS
jgi:hypothetical protein